MKDDEQVWYLPDDKTLQADGPYSTQEILGRVRAGDIRLDSFVFRAEFRLFGWKRICEIADFAEVLAAHPICPIPKNLGRVAEKEAVQKEMMQRVEGAYSSDNVYRRFLRAPLNCDCYIHEEHHLLRGRISDISEAGTSVVIDPPKFKTGDELMLVVRGPDPIKTFTVPSVVMRSVLHAKTQLLGMHFLRLNPGVRRKIAQYVLQELYKKTQEKAAA